MEWEFCDPPDFLTWPRGVASAWDENPWPSSGSPSVTASVWETPAGNGWRSPSNPVALTQTPELLSAAERDVVQTMQDDPPLPLEVGSSAHSGEEAVLTQLNLRLNSLSS